MAANTAQARGLRMLSSWKAASTININYVFIFTLPTIDTCFYLALRGRLVWERGRKTCYCYDKDGGGAIGSDEQMWESEYILLELEWLLYYLLIRCVMDNILIITRLCIYMYIYYMYIYIIYIYIIYTYIYIIYIYIYTYNIYTYIYIIL